MNTFYMVFVEGGATPACKHDSLDSAEKEAKRLATLLKKKAYVLCTIKSVEESEKGAYLMKKTRIIAIEGIDGSGKGVQYRLMRDALLARGYTGASKASRNRRYRSLIHC